MINPMPKVKPPTTPQKIAAAGAKVTRIISRNRELAIAVFFLVVGFVMGRL